MWGNVGGERKLTHCGWVGFDELGFKSRHRGVVFLLGSRGGAAAGDGGVDQLDQLIDLVGVFLCEVGFFSWVSLQIIELYRVKAFSGFARTGLRPATGAGAEAEFPLALADGKRAVDGVVDGEGTSGLFFSC